YGWTWRRRYNSQSPSPRRRGPYSAVSIGLILRSARGCVSKDGAFPWFETRRGVYHQAALCAVPLATLLTMRPREAVSCSPISGVLGFILRDPRPASHAR